MTLEAFKKAEKLIKRIDILKVELSKLEQKEQGELVSISFFFKKSQNEIQEYSFQNQTSIVHLVQPFNSKDFRETYSFFKNEMVMLIKVLEQDLSEL